jgi:hypothetical protein
MGEKIKTDMVLVGKPERTRPVGRARRRWEDNIKVGLKMEWDGTDWIHVAQYRDRYRAVVNTAINLRVS